MTGARVYAADLFCGAGGASRGLGRACERLGRPVDLVAINHWPKAVATHERNHPWARHHCARVESLDPRKVVPGGMLDLIVAGVECTHHSRARGGKPMSDQSRASAWHVLHWAEMLHVREVLIENVAEFVQWGPLDADGRPVPEKKGATFRAFVSALESLNYSVEWRLLTAADYGDPTTRRRFFLRARLGGGAIEWPDATHNRDGVSGLQPWRTARQIIEWGNLGESIFRRRRPLADRTVARIAEGIRRFCGEYAEPFLVMLYGSSTVRSVDRPCPTVTAGSGHIGLAQPFLLPPDGPMRHDEVQAPRSVDRPMHTVRAERGGGHLVLPFLLQANQGNKPGARANSVDKPLGTVVAKNHLGLVAPYLVRFDHAGGDRPVTAPRSVDDPVPTVTGKTGLGLATPFILPHDQFVERNGLSLIDSVDDPLRTVKARAGAAGNLVVPFIVPHFGEREGQQPRTHSVDDPCPTVTGTKGAGSLVQPFIAPYYGTGVPDSVDDPLAAVTTRDRFGLCSPESAGGVAVDIFFRMLSPVELARAQGFPDDYEFVGTKTDVVRQIGNAIPVGMAEHLCHSILDRPEVA